VICEIHQFHLHFSHGVLLLCSLDTIRGDAITRFRAAVSVLVGPCCFALLNCTGVDVHTAVLLDYWASKMMMMKYDTIRYDTRCYFNVAQKLTRVSLIYRTKPKAKKLKKGRLKSKKNGYAQKYR